MSLKPCCCVFAMKKVGLREAEARPGPALESAGNPIVITGSEAFPGPILENQGLVCFFVLRCFKRQFVSIPVDTSSTVIHCGSGRKVTLRRALRFPYPKSMSHHYRHRETC
jgi:hypothetical protein